MKTIQMWRDLEYPDELVQCAKSVISIVGKDNYQLVCNSTELPKILGVPSINFDDEYNRVLSIIGNRKWWGDYCIKNYFMSDMLRLYYATQIKDLFYLDIDITLKQMPVFNKFSRPYLMDRDFCMFYVNGRIDWFQNVINEVVKTPPYPMCIFHYIISEMTLVSHNITPNYYIRKDFGIKWKSI
jgi:hypothetical protein